MIKTGLYEQVISKKLSDEIDENQPKMLFARRAVDHAETPHVLSSYLAEVIEKGLSRISERDTDAHLKLADKIVSAVQEMTGDQEFGGLGVKPDEKMNAQLLLAAAEKANNPDAREGKITIPRPETSLASSSLFTGAVHEPSMMSELRKEIASADAIDVLVSFIKWSGLVLLFDELKQFTEKGGKLRVITTSYMGATDLKAVEELSRLPGAEVKVSYDTRRTRLHAKAYIFYRDTGFTTAYVGSSNMSNAALTEGLEWNLKVTEHDQNHTIRKIGVTFESYWNSSEFHPFSAEKSEDSRRLAEALKTEKKDSSEEGYLFDIRPFSYQQEILDSLAAEREIHQSYKNLVVAATGTGKTVISAFDYRRFCREAREKQKRTPRLLFVAHRKEILEQSLKCFRGVLRDPNFGELFFSGEKPSGYEHLFISIETFNSQKFDQKTEPDFYDFIVVDEFHHAAAPTYQRLLEYYQPKILLGLTATPDRMDGVDILSYFDGRVAAEIQLPEAIDRKLLSPFHYFGVSDEVSLEDVKWSRGGYDAAALSDLYVGNDQRVRQIYDEFRRYTADIGKVKGLGFCVSKEHARYMAERFNQLGVASIALTADSPKEERYSAQKRLAQGELKFIFIVDLYNEGVDIPEVNTVMFLRPTESLTVFLQQLGRGLRLAEGKDCLTVLDFIGQANAKYRFESKFAALLGKTRHSVEHEIKQGFPILPKGCYIKLEKQAERYILENIRQSISTKKAMVQRIKTFKEDTGRELTLANFLNHYNLDPSVLYRDKGKKSSFARLCVEAGMRDDFHESVEETVTQALPRLSYLDSRRLLRFFLDNLPQVCGKTAADYTSLDLCMWQMLQFTIWKKSYAECQFNDLLDGFREIAHSPVMLEEIMGLLRYKYDKIDFIDEAVEIGYDCPLDVYCSYSRDQILTALGFMKPDSMREGVKYLEEKKTDLLFVTLNKADKDYSPTTMYNDYSIDSEHFHWQSQSTTSCESPTGQRYLNQRRNGTIVMLFVREFKTNEYGAAAPFTFLGLADFVKSEGSKPMNIVWKLRRPIPAKFLRKTNQLTLG